MNQILYIFYKCSFVSLHYLIKMNVSVVGEPREWVGSVWFIQHSFKRQTGRQAGMELAEGFSGMCPWLS